MFANLHNYVQINPSLAVLSERLQLKQVCPSFPQGIMCTPYLDNLRPASHNRRASHSIRLLGPATVQTSVHLSFLGYDSTESMANFSHSGTLTSNFTTQTYKVRNSPSSSSAFCRYREILQTLIKFNDAQQLHNREKLINMAALWLKCTT